MESLDGYLTVSEAASRLGVRRQWVLQLIHDQRLTAIRVSRLYLIDHTSLATYEAQRRWRSGPARAAPASR